MRQSLAKLLRALLNAWGWLWTCYPLASATWASGITCCVPSHLARTSLVRVAPDIKWVPQVRWSLNISRINLLNDLLCWRWVIIWSVKKAKTDKWEANLFPVFASEFKQCKEFMHTYWLWHLLCKDNCRHLLVPPWTKFISFLNLRIILAKCYIFGDLFSNHKNYYHSDSILITYSHKKFLVKFYFSVLRWTNDNHIVHGTLLDPRS